MVFGVPLLYKPRQVLSSNLDLLICNHKREIMDIIKQTAQYIIIRKWLNIPASYPLDEYDFSVIREDQKTATTINSYFSCYEHRGWAYISKEKIL